VVNLSRLAPQREGLVSAALHLLEKEAIRRFERLIATITLLTLSRTQAARRAGRSIAAGIREMDLAGDAAVRLTAILKTGAPLAAPA